MQQPYNIKPRVALEKLSMRMSAKKGEHPLVMHHDVVQSVFFTCSSRHHADVLKASPPNVQHHKH
jgi:hypothetical protein